MHAIISNFTRFKGKLSKCFLFLPITQGRIFLILPITGGGGGGGEAALVYLVSVGSSPPPRFNSNFPLLHNLCVHFVYVAP